MYPRNNKSGLEQHNRTFRITRSVLAEMYSTI